MATSASSSASASASTTPSWTTVFKSNLSDMYEMVSSGYDDCILTGSGAVALLVLAKGTSDDIARLPKPNDLDFLVVDHDTVAKPYQFGPYTIKSTQSVTTKSVTYEVLNGSSFDLMSVPRVSFVVIDNIKVILPSSLLDMYRDENREKDHVKIQILQNMINSDTLFNLVERSAKIEKAGRPAFDMNDDSVPGRLNFGFGDDSDEEEDTGGLAGRLDFGFGDDSDEEN